MTALLILALVLFLIGGLPLVLIGVGIYMCIWCLLMIESWRPTDG